MPNFVKHFTTTNGTVCDILATQAETDINGKNITTYISGGSISGNDITLTDSTGTTVSTISLPIKFEEKTAISNFNNNGDTWTPTADGFLQVRTPNTAISSACYCYVTEPSTGTPTIDLAISCPNGNGGLTNTQTIPVVAGVPYTLSLGGFSTVVTYFIGYKS